MCHHVPCSDTRCLLPTAPQGFLLPAFHYSYWLGLISNESAWPAFDWSDPFMAAPGGAEGFSGWGEAQPDEQQAGLLCGAAQGALAGGLPRMWGWADVRCSEQSYVMCRIMGGWRRPAPLAWRLLLLAVSGTSGTGRLPHAQPTHAMRASHAV
jgi:hypothetical protein